VIIGAFAAWGKGQEPPKPPTVTARRFPPPWSVEEQPACFVDHFRTPPSSWRSPSCERFCVLLLKLEQQCAELYSTNVGAGVKKDSGPYTFVQPLCVGHHQKYESDAAVALPTDSYLHLI
jgi:hypothetical protein